MIYNVTDNLRVIDSKHGFKIQKLSSRIWRNEKHSETIEYTALCLRRMGFGEDVIRGLHKEVKAAQKRACRIAAREWKRFRVEVV